MCQNANRRIGAVASLVIFVGCQTGVNSPSTVKADPPKLQATAADNVKASLVTTEQPKLSAKPPAKTADTEQGGPKVRTAFYRADKKPASMPHVLWELQGDREPQFTTEKAHGHDIKIFSGWKQVSPGVLTPLQYDEAMGDLVGYLQWMSEPSQNYRVRVGAWVLLFLTLLTVIVWRLNAAFWKDIK